MGAKYYLADITGKEGKLAASGGRPAEREPRDRELVAMGGREACDPLLCEKAGLHRRQVQGRAIELSSHKAHFCWFGVADAKVQQNLFSVLEPQLFDPQVGLRGVHPDQSRNRLIFTGNGDKGAAIPMADWGNEFSDSMPEEIREAILKARGEGPNTLTDEEYRKRLQDKFGSRWTTTQLVQRKERPDDDETISANATNEEAQVIERMPNPNPHPNPSTRKRKRRVHVIHLRALASGNGQGVECEVAVDVPRFTYVGKDEFENPWHLASWAPTDPQGPPFL